MSRVTGRPVVAALVAALAAGVAATPAAHAAEATLACDVLVVGDSAAAVAATLGARSQGVTTCLVGETGALGGQLLSVPAIDFASFEGTFEESWDDLFGVDTTASESFFAFLRQVQEHYITTYSLSSYAVQDGLYTRNDRVLDPGDCWVSTMCYESTVGASVLSGMLAASGAVIWVGYRPTGVTVHTDGNGRQKVDAVRFESTSDPSATLLVTADVTVDASPYADVLRILANQYGLELLQGAEPESRFGEIDAPDVACPVSCYNPLTATATVSRNVDLSPAGPVPAHPPIPNLDITSEVIYWASAIRNRRDADDAYWHYRSSADLGVLPSLPRELAVANWGTQDFSVTQWCVGGQPSGCNPMPLDVDYAERAAIVGAARNYALAFVDGLQDRMPNVGFVNWATPYPYLREAVRIVAEDQITQPEIMLCPGDFTSAGYRGVDPRAVDDAIAIGQYGSLDFHLYPNGTRPTLACSGMRFTEVGLGSLIPLGWAGLLAAELNMGTTHITNSGLRTHPTVWTVGEGAGVAAALAAASGADLRDYRAGDLYTQLAAALRIRGVPTQWSIPFNQGRFDDDDDTYYESWVEAFSAAGLTAGCEPRRYCGEGIVTRAEAAVFTYRILEPITPSGTDHYTDDQGHFAEAFINAITDVGITSGCGAGVFCPDAPITRGEVAVWLVRALQLPPVATDFFTDDNGTPEEPYINALRAAGLTAGCGPAVFCPGSSMSRGQAAIFYGIALGLQPIEPFIDWWV